jgi:hypothetical protein
MFIDSSSRNSSMPVPLVCLFDSFYLLNLYRKHNDEAGKGLTLQQQQQQQQLQKPKHKQTRSVPLPQPQSQLQQQQQQQRQTKGQPQLATTHVQQHEQQQQQQLPASIVSLQALIYLHQQQQQQLSATTEPLPPPRVLQEALQTLNPDQLSTLIKLWAQEARSMRPQELQDAQQQQLLCYCLNSCLSCYNTVTLRRLQQGQLDRQQLADVAWGLAHFDALEWRCQQQQQQQQQCDGSWQQQQQQECCRLPLRWSGPFQAAMAVPFLVLPNLMPDLLLNDVTSEVTLSRDVIYLSDNSGGSRAVPEARLTGWQSDIGATFFYSGKEMQPQPGGMTPICAQVCLQNFFVLSDNRVCCKIALVRVDGGEALL